MTSHNRIEEIPTYLPDLRRGLDRSTAIGYLLTIPGTAHATFSDAPLWMPPVPSLAGSPGRTEGHRIIASQRPACFTARLC